MERQKKEGVTRKLCAFELQEKGIPRHGYEIADAEGNVIGVVTSGTMSPVLKKGIGMGYVKPEFAKAGTDIFIKVRNKNLKAQVVKAPFRNKIEKLDMINMLFPGKCSIVSTEVGYRSFSSFYRRSSGLR